MVSNCFVLQIAKFVGPLVAPYFSACETDAGSARICAGFAPDLLQAVLEAVGVRRGKGWRYGHRLGARMYSQRFQFYLVDGSNMFQFKVPKTKKHMGHHPHV